VSLSPHLDWSQETPITVESIDVARAFGQLKLPERQILILRYYANLSMQETADALGLTTEAAKSRIHRALRKLRPYVSSDDVAEVF
jgi:RNA polymerase sigma-70 factor (ECF subfamily)